MVSEMQALLYYGNRDLRLETMPMPEVSPHEVLVKITEAGLSQTQINEFAEGPFFINPEPHPRTHLAIPIVPCQEFGGEVIKVGDMVNPQWLGKLVGVLPLESCEDCRYCAEGKINLCPTIAYKGVLGSHGGFSQYISVPTSELFEVQHKDQLTYIEPMLVGVHSWLRLKHLVNAEQSNVLIIGAGAVGIATAIVWRDLAGIQQVTIHDRLSERLERCQAMNISVLKEVSNQAQAYDVVIDLGGKDPLVDEQALAMANNLCRPGGAVILMGSYFSPISIIPMHLLTTEKSWIPSFAYDHNDVSFLRDNLHKIQSSFEPTIDRLSLSDLIEKGYYEAELDKSQFIRLVCTPHG